MPKSTNKVYYPIAKRMMIKWIFLPDMVVIIFNKRN